LRNRLALKTSKLVDVVAGKGVVKELSHSRKNQQRDEGGGPATKNP